MSLEIALLAFRRLRMVAAVSVVMLSIASAGYVVIEGYTWFDAIYMTIITLGTIGYGEVNPLDKAGRAWTMFVIVGGFTLLVYTAATLTSFFVSDELSALVKRRRRQKMREGLIDHVIVVGFGRVGRAAATAVMREGRRCVVIDEDVALGDEVMATGAAFVHGDARQEEPLRAARVDRAVAVVTALDDPSNLVVILTARSLRHDLRVVSRVNEAAWRDRLLRAGAAQAVPLYESVGINLAATALDADVLGVQDLPGLGVRTEEIVVGDGSAAVGRTLGELMADEPEVLLLGVRREHGLTSWHEVTGALEVADVLVALGSPTALDRLQETLAADVEPGATA
jgi:voltage-gated potassium channel